MKEEALLDAYDNNKKGLKEGDKDSKIITDKDGVKINDYMSASSSKMQQILKSSVSKTPTNKIHKY